MSEILQRVVALVNGGRVRVSEHGYDELAADSIAVRDLVAGVGTAEAVEDYPDHARGPCVLALQANGEGRPVHVLWGIPKGESDPVVLVTAYRPDPQRWEEDFRRRKQ